MEYLKIIIIAVLINNLVLSQFLGVCPFCGSSGSSRAMLRTAVLMILMITVSVFLTTLVRIYILGPFHIEFLQTISFILVLLLLNYIFDFVVKKAGMKSKNTVTEFPFLELNCAVLGTVLLTAQSNFSVLMSVIFGFSMAVGYVLVLVVMSGIREQTEITGIPAGMRGVPINLIIAGLLSLAFMGFNGIGHL